MQHIPVKILLLSLSFVLLMVSILTTSAASVTSSTTLLRLKFPLLAASVQP